MGELWTRSPYTMLGYWEKPERLVTLIDADRWLSTGDAGYFDDEGYLFLNDRIKDMIVCGGENVYPAEVENVLLGTCRRVGRCRDRGARRQWGETVKAIS